MQVEPEVIAVAGTVVAGLVGAVVKLYADVIGAHKELRAMEKERRDDAKLAKDDALEQQKIVIETVNKISTLNELERRRPR